MEMKKLMDEQFAKGGPMDQLRDQRNAIVENITDLEKAITAVGAINEEKKLSDSI